MSIKQYFESLRGAVNSVASLTKDIGDAYVQKTVNDAFSEAFSQINGLYNEMLDIQKRNLDLSEAILQLRQEKEELAQQLVKASDIDYKLQHYVLTPVAAGAFVYIYKSVNNASIESDKATYWFCPNCLKQFGNESVLQKAEMDKADRLYRCQTPGCGFCIRVHVPATVGVRRTRMQSMR